MVYFNQSLADEFNKYGYTIGVGVLKKGCMVSCIGGCCFCTSMGKMINSIKDKLGVTMTLKNDKSKADLGMEFSDSGLAIRTMGYDLINKGAIERKDIP